MKEITLAMLKPFVRYARRLDSDIRKFPDPIIAYDCRLFYCIGGKGEMEVGGEAYKLKQGAVVYFTAETPYKYIPNDLDPPRLLAFNFDMVYDCSHMTLPFPPERVENFNREKTVAKVKVTDSAHLSQSCVLYGMQHLYAKLSEINEEFSSAKMFYEARCSGLMLSVLSEIAFYAEGQGERAGIGVVDGVIDYLAKHYAEDISNATLGEMFGYHPNYLNQLFIRFTGKSLHKYLLDLRILHAVKLLQDTDLSVCAVANEVGFRDVPHFSRYFKQKMGCSPVKFR